MATSRALDETGTFVVQLNALEGKPHTACVTYYFDGSRSVRASSSKVRMNEAETRSWAESVLIFLSQTFALSGIIVHIVLQVYVARRMHSQANCCDSLHSTVPWQRTPWLKLFWRVPCRMSHEPRQRPLEPRRAVRLLQCCKNLQQKVEEGQSFVKHL